MRFDALTLAKFLLARIAEDEAAARGALRDSAETSWRPAETDRGVWRREEGQTGTEITGTSMTIYEEGGHTIEQATHIVRWDPARVLAECEAKRRIVTWFIDGNIPSEPDDYGYYALIDVMGEMASVYADHPDYQAKWRP